MYSERYKERGGEGERQVVRKGECERDSEKQRRTVMKIQIDNN